MLKLQEDRVKHVFLLNNLSIICRNRRHNPYISTLPCKGFLEMTNNYQEKAGNYK